MPNPTTPKRTKVEPQRAQGLPDEITAQPRTLADEIAADTRNETGLSIDADDLGKRFLTEVTETGEAARAVPSVEMMSESPSDEALVGSNLDPSGSLWERQVDLALQSEQSSEQLRAPSAQEPDEDEVDDDYEDPQQRPVQLDQSATRESSLLDPDLVDSEPGSRERSRSDDLRTEAYSRDARQTSREPLGARPEPARDGANGHAPQAAARPRRARSTGLRGLARSVLVKAARFVRKAAQRRAR